MWRHSTEKQFAANMQNSFAFRLSLAAANGVFFLYRKLRRNRVDPSSFLWNDNSLLCNVFHLKVIQNVVAAILMLLVTVDYNPTYSAGVLMAWVTLNSFAPWSWWIIFVRYFMASEFDVMTDYNKVKRCLQLLGKIVLLLVFYTLMPILVEILLNVCTAVFLSNSLFVVVLQSLTDFDLFFKDFPKHRRVLSHVATSSRLQKVSGGHDFSYVAHIMHVLRQLLAGHC